MEYAILHNFNVKFTATQSCNSVEVVYNFIKNGFKVKFKKENQYSSDGIKLDDKINILFIKKGE